MNQQEVDDLIKIEEEFMNTQQAEEMQAIAPGQEDSKLAEELFQQEAQNIKSQNSMTSSKKRRIKVTNEQKQMVESATSFWSKKKPSGEAPSQTLDQMMADVNDVAP